jgi:hypothetical protein
MQNVVIIRNFQRTVGTNRRTHRRNCNTQTEKAGEWTRREELGDPIQCGRVEEAFEEGQGPLKAVKPVVIVMMMYDLGFRNTPRTMSKGFNVSADVAVAFCMIIVLGRFESW